MKFSGKVGNGPMNKWLNFHGDQDHPLDIGIVSGFATVGRYEKRCTVHDAAAQGMH